MTSRAKNRVVRREVHSLMEIIVEFDSQVVERSQDREEEARPEAAQRERRSASQRKAYAVAKLAHC